jgi:repressor LexA
MLEDGINRNTGKPITPSIPKLKLVAAGMGMSLHELFGLADDMEIKLGKEEEEEPETIPGIYPVRKKSFPVLGKVACGEPIFAEEDHETSIMASADIDADFCLIAQGESMTGAHIEDGDIVFIRQMEVVPNGKIAVVLIEDEATLKYIEYRPEQATLILTPANPAFRTQIYSGEELNQIRVLGQAVTLQKDLTRR